MRDRVLSCLSFIGLVCWAQTTNVGIGTSFPTHRLHLGNGTLRIENLSGTGTVLAQTSALGVLGRFIAASNATQLLQGNAIWGSDATDWKLLGNAATSPATHFVGTTDLQDFRMAVNNTTQWRILSTGEHLVGSNTTAILNNARVSIDAPTGWIAVYARVTGGRRPAIRGTVGDNTSGPAVSAVNTASNGWGAIGLGSGSTIGNLPPSGGGAYGAGQTVGVIGSHNGTNENGRSGGAFAVRDAGGSYDWVYVAGYEAGNQRKIWGVGAVSTTIYDVQSKNSHILFCPEAPEVLFWDQGRFTLTTQEQWVPIDTLLALHIAPPFSVFLQPWGDISVRVIEVRENGFRVQADRVPSVPIPVSFFLQARRKGSPHSPFHEERLPSVDPKRYFSPFRPVMNYLPPACLQESKP
ncbi:MAG: hypothetical protein NZZ60_03425 [Bacteroidia bacterium]|nr:hypothetical protein [Bacteroidia bacterium]